MKAKNYIVALFAVLALASDSFAAPKPAKKATAKKPAASSSARASSKKAPAKPAAKSARSATGTNKKSTARSATGGNSSARTERKTNEKRVVSSQSSQTTSTSKETTTATESAASAASYTNAQCRTAYVSCMDNQIKDIVGRYAYLDEDTALQATLKTGQNFRCLYFDKSHSTLTDEMKLVKECKEIAAQNGASDAEIAYQCGARDINDLYYAYNYYCEVNPSSVRNALGRTTNYCKLSPEDESNEVCSAGDKECAERKIRFAMSNIFANGSSIAYYNEAARRVDNGELKMVNFTDSELYKQKLEGLGIDNLKGFDAASLMRTDTDCSSYNYIDHTGASVSLLQPRTYAPKADDGAVAQTVTFAANSPLDYEYKYNAKYAVCQKFNKSTNRFVEIETEPPVLSKAEDMTKQFAQFDALPPETQISMIDSANGGKCKGLDKSSACVQSVIKHYCNDSFYDDKLRQCVRCARGAWNPLIRSCQSGYKPSISEAEVMMADADASFQEALASDNTAPQILKDRAVEMRRIYTDKKRVFAAEVETSKSFDKLMIPYDFSVFHEPELTPSPEDRPRDIYSDLGLTRSSSLFSINVVPPLGAGEMFPGYLFGKASDYCFDGAIKLGKTAAETKKYQEFNKQKKLLAGCADTRGDVEKYYLSGFWPKSEEASKEYVESDFMSAKKSCDVYEQALVSVRDKYYGDFDTQIKNYLEDAVAKVLQNKMKDLKKLSNMAITLQDWDNEIVLEQMQLETERRKLEAQKLLTEAERKNAALAKKLLADKKAMEIREKNRKVIRDKFKTELVEICGLAGGDMLKNTAVGKSGHTVALLSALIARTNANGEDINAQRPEDSTIAGVSSGNAYTDTARANEALVNQMTVSDSAIPFVKYAKGAGGNIVTSRGSMNPPDDYYDFPCGDFPEFFKNGHVVSGISALTKSDGSLKVAAIVDAPTKKELPMGIYKTKLSGAGGGGLGRNCKTYAWKYDKDGKADDDVKKDITTGKGGNGELKEESFMLLKPSPYILTAGVGGNYAYYNGTAKKGQDSTLEITSDENIKFSAEGGQGGFTTTSTNRDGESAGNGQGASGGSVNHNDYQTTRHTWDSKNDWRCKDSHGNGGGDGSALIYAY